MLMDFALIWQILEAIHLLGTGRANRSAEPSSRHHNDPILMEDQTRLIAEPWTAKGTGPEKEAFQQAMKTLRLW